MDKATIIQAFGSAAAVARFFGISDAAVSAWPDGPIPELRELQLRLRRPDLFVDPPSEEGEAA